MRHGPVGAYDRSVRDPTQDDAALYLRYLALSQSELQVEARAWFFQNFDATSYAELEERYPQGSRERHLLSELLGFYESAGVLVSRGLLHEDVFYDAPFGFELVWKKVGAILNEWRREIHPAAWENVAWLGERYEIWSTKSWRPKLEAVPPDRGPPPN
jgi:hypothetical protein